MRVFSRLKAGLARNVALAVVVAAAVACSGSGVSLIPPSAFVLTTLVSDVSSAVSTDAHLRDPWGLVAPAASPMWVANNLDHSATQYDGTGVVQPAVLDVSVTGTPAGDVTGVVASSSETDFEITNGVDTAPARLIFASESGTLLGWSPDVDALSAITAYSDAGGAQYTGLAIAGTGSGTQLYAADFHNNKIDIFDHEFTKLDGTGKFVDATLPVGYAPYNVKALQLQGAVVVAVVYAQRDPVSGNAVVGAGLGAVNLYSTAGALQTRIVAPGGRLNAPWGVTVAPTAFGTLSGALLVANNGDGRINGFNLATGDHLHAIEVGNSAIEIDGLRGLAFGNGARNQPATTLYLTAGGNNGTNGVFARIDLESPTLDVVPPANVAVTAPAAAAEVSGTVPVSATATDNTRVARIVFSVETGGNTREIGTDTTSPYSVNWNTGTVANGAATLIATAFDTAGNATTSPGVAVDVDNGVDSTPPTVTITAPQPGNVSGMVTVTATATDNLGVGVVRFFAGATLIGTDTTLPFSVQWNTAGLTGARVLTAVAQDGAGNSTTSSAVNVTIVGAVTTLAQLQATVFTPQCASCHTGGGSSLPGSMNLSSVATTYDALVNQTSVNEPGLQLVSAGNPDASYLIRKLEGTQTVGERMPKDAPPLSPVVIDQVRAWIQAGATE